MAHPASVSVELLQLVAGYAARSGVAVGDALEPVEEALADPGGRVPFRAFSSVFDALASASHDPCFGLHLGEAAMERSGGHVLFAVMRNCPTLQAAVSRFFRYHAILSDATRPLVRPGARTVWLELEPRGAGRPGRHYSEAVVAMLATALRALPETPVDPVEVRFAHTAPDGTSEHARLFRCRVVFGAAETALAFTSADMAAPVFMANRELLGTLDRFAAGLLGRVTTPETWAGRSSAQVAARLAAGDRPLVGSVAAALGVSPRLLQARLRGEGTSFQRELDEVRRTLAIAHLRDGSLSMCDLAFLLGFSEQSAFNRAFKRWTGKTPGELRRLNGAQA